MIWFVRILGGVVTRHDGDILTLDPVEIADFYYDLS